MLKKLKRRFVFINMLLVSIVLIVVLVAMTLTSYQRTMSETKAALFRALDHDSTMEIPKFEIGIGANPPVNENGGKQMYMSQPVFTVTLDSNGNITDYVAENVTVSDDVLRDAVDAVSASDAKEGSISSLSLMYVVRQLPDGTEKIAFIDVSSENAAIAAEGWRNVLIGAVALLAFLLISIFLSNVAMRPVEKAWSQQRQFVADASHELKTPLTVILASLGILASHKRESIESNMKWVESAEAESQRMKGLINDMLYLAKSDAEQAPITFYDVDFSDVLLSCVLPFESVAFERGITLDSDIKNGVTCHGNEALLKQLVTILMDNACKYCNDGGKITVTLANEGHNSALLNVSNTGEPISADDAAHIFERFYRTDKSRTSIQKGGYGLGLAIAKSIVDSHHGKISVESDETIGTRFTVKI